MPQLKRRDGPFLTAITIAGLLCLAPQSHDPSHDPESSSLTLESYFEGRWLSRPQWSPNGRYLSFLWTDWESQNLYVVEPEGGEPTSLTRSTDFIGGTGSWSVDGSFGSWSPDGSSIVYSHRGDLYRVAVPAGDSIRLTDTVEAETAPSFAPDGHRLAYLRDGNVYLLGLEDDGQSRRVTADGRGRGPLRWSPDGEKIAFGISDPAAVSWARPPYSGPLLAFRWSRRVTTDAAVVQLDGDHPSVRILAGSTHQERVLDWSPDSDAVLVERQSRDTKSRTLLLADADGAKTESLYAQVDDKYITPKDRMAEFSPDGRSVLFTSDEDGWNHLYLQTIDDGHRRQLTSGAFEVSYPEWTPDGKRVVFVATDPGPEQRQIFLLDVERGEKRPLTDHPGTNTYALPSPDGRHVAYIRSDYAHFPDLWVIGLDRESRPEQLTSSMTAELQQHDWQPPKIITYPGKGDLPIAGQLFLPSEFDPRQEYPGIVHLHGAAIDQAVFLGPGPNKTHVTWWAWHQRLADLGYVVFSMDYRGSYGYGRDFRTADYLALGDDPIVDVVRGVDYLKKLGYVDEQRLGVYGLSTGGRMVMTVLFKHPDVFQAGINIAGGFDYFVEGGPWDVRNSWVQNRLGTPTENPEAFFSASAINFIDGLSVPLFTLQGTADTAVNLTNSIKLVDELLKRGKRFEFEIYPGENHFFARQRSWLDAFDKMERFFDEHLGHDAARSR